MTDRYNAFIVILDHDIRSDNAQSQIEAIKMIRGVLDVVPHVASLEDAIATNRAKQEILERVYKTIVEDISWKDKQ